MKNLSGARQLVCQLPKLFNRVGFTSLAFELTLAREPPVQDEAANAEQVEAVYDEAAIVWRAEKEDEATIFGAFSQD